ncbi:uncharacterized protein LOC135153989 [Lytechinus pictus]|uniref:uncharacterized protein LOC135153989 n=1 Tax=Lytechinus pictus TaxID=7653 RepID=UPI0030B9FD2E
MKMNQIPAHDFPLNSGGRNTSEDPLHSGLLNWLCDATLIGGGGGFASSRISGKMIEKGEEESLSKLLGLPLTETHLQTVLSATCKHAINNLRRSGEHGPDGLVGLSRPMINQAFRRVYRFLYGEEAPQEDDITIMIQKISIKSSGYELLSM